MAGRPGKPTDLILLEGKDHRTKAEIEARRKKERGLRSGADYRTNEKVKANPEAMKMFRKLKKLYKSIDYVEGLDENIINRYCLLTAEAGEMEKLLERMDNDVDKCEKPSQMVSMYKAISGLEGNLNRARDMLLKMEDRLFLNPTARVKNVPKKPEEKPETEFDRKFGNV